MVRAGLFQPAVSSRATEEISRQARREAFHSCRRLWLVSGASSLKKSSAAHRSEIAALKRRVVELERQLRRAGRGGQGTAPTAANDDSVTPGTRFSAKSMAAQRRRLGLSAAECGLLIGASAQSVYNWEEGKARPRAQHLPSLPCGAWVAGRRTRSWKPVKPPRYCELRRTTFRGIGCRQDYRTDEPRDLEGSEGP
jgi:DNA-binding transcriptional regulator YiaG